MFQSVNYQNPRKLLNAWEAQALATLTAKNLPNSFKAVSEIMHDETKDIEVHKRPYGSFIISTNFGLLSCHEARAMNIGGELMCEIY